MNEARAISKIIACTTAGTYNLYTCPSNCRAKIPLVFITNANGTNTVQLKWYRKQQNTSFYVVGGKNLSLGEFVQLSDGYIVLEPEDRLDVTISSNGNVDALCTAEETFIANIARA
jgi:hypothetical protein